ETFFEVRFPGGVIGVRFPLDLVMPLDRRAGGGEELDGVDDPFPPDDRPLEDPMSPTDGTEVFVFDPSPGFLGMSALGPLPESMKDRVVHLRKGSLARHVAVIVRPSPDDRV